MYANYDCVLILGKLAKSNLCGRGANRFLSVHLPSLAFLQNPVNVFILDSVRVTLATRAGHRKLPHDLFRNPLVTVFLLAI